MNKIKSFRISEENQKHLTRIAKKQDLSESWIINKALEKYFKTQKPQKNEKPFTDYFGGLFN